MKYKDENGNWKELSIKASDTLPIGSIIPFGGTEAPTNWLICDGSMLNRAAYPELFKAIGTSFGTDGPNNFYIPDLRGRVIVGQDTSDADFGIGLTGGEKTHTLNVSEMPSHTHNNQMAVFYDIDKNYGLTQGTLYSDRIIGRYDGETNYVAGVQNIKNTGGGQPHNNLQPYTVTNYIIKAKQSIGVVGNVVNEKTTSDKDTYSCDYINEKSSYSTEEKVVGEWIDGKPIYRKVIFADNVKYGPGDVAVNIPHNINNLETPVKVDYKLYSSNLGWLIDWDGLSKKLTVNNTNVVLNHIGDGSYTFTRTYVTIEYTKTTD